VIIRGKGVAASCCAHLLSKAGFRVDLDSVDRPPLPVILLGDHALALLRDVFDQPDIFDNAPRLRKRVVAWGVDAKAIELVHSAVLVSEETILNAIRPRIAPQGEREFEWVILAGRPSPRDYGPTTRVASVIPVQLKNGSPVDTCWIESLEDGWLFLTPGWMLAVGATADALLGDSRVVVAQIAQHGPVRGAFPASARIASPLGWHGWLACGSAAMAFDPICGDGTAHAVREAILASAVVRAIADGGSEDELLAHYHARLIAGFQRHLLLCRQFYSTGGTGLFWQSEVTAIDRRIDWCRDARSAYGSFRYQLRGFELEAVR
jgi:hypothetical protein